MEKNKKDNEDIHQKTEDVLKKIQRQMKLTDDILNSASYRKSTTFARKRPIINSERQNIVKIKDSSLEFVNIDEDYINKPKDSIFDDICSICSKKIYYEKYLCIICKDCIICSNCELNHLHPMIKWKNNQLPNLNSIFLFLSYNNKSIKVNTNGGFFGNNKPKYEFRLESQLNEYTMKPKEKKILPINIVNLNKISVNCKKLKLILFSSNIKDLIIYSKEIDNKIKSGETLKTSISVESSSFCKIYNFNIGLFSNEDIEIVFNTLSIKLRVFIDYEEEDLNLKFKDYPEIIKENKITKKNVRKIMENEKIKQNPIIILKTLKQNKGNVHEAVKNLISKNKDNES